MENDVQRPPPPVTFFTTCKPFVGEHRIMQENAIRSWREQDIPVIILGNDAGSKTYALKYNCLHIPEVEVGSSGVPLVSDLFDKAESYANTEFLAYLNSDIICTHDTIAAISTLTSLKLPKKFLYTTHRINIPLSDPLLTEREQWMEQVKQLTRQFGTWDHPYAIDIFLFNRGWLKNIPDFSIGRPGWDNWMLWNALTQEAALIDGSFSGPILHPFHGYECAPGGVTQVVTGTDASANRSLSGAKKNGIADSATHLLKDNMLVKINDELRQKLSSFCSIDTEKRYLCDLHCVHTNNTQHSDTELIDRIKTVLWRAGLFTSSATNTEQQRITSAKKCLSLAIKSAKKDSLGESQNILQDFICDHFLTKIREIKRSARPIYIWGASTAGRQVLSLLERHEIPVNGFIDSNAETLHITNTADKGRIQQPIYPPSQLVNLKPKPYIIIGSMYLAEISDQLHTEGFQRDIDYTY